MDAPALIIPESQLDMLSPDRKARLQDAVSAAVADSFISHPMRHVTMSEVKRRNRICLVAFRTARNEHKYAFQRAVDLMPVVLRNSLDQVEQNLSRRNSWFARG